MVAPACLATVAPKALYGWKVKSSSQQIRCRGGRVAYISLQHCGLTLLPASIGDLTALTNLGFEHNGLASLPESVGGLTALTQLGLSYNNVTSLPDSISGLTELTELFLPNNRLTSLTNSIGELTALTALILDHNALTSLPDSIGSLTALTHLGVSYNDLTSLPESIGGLTALTRLFLKYNRLTSLPDSICGLRLLGAINLADNFLAVLPVNFGNLGQNIGRTNAGFYSLNLDGNVFMDLPLSLVSLTHMQTSTAARNPLRMYILLLSAYLRPALFRQLPSTSVVALSGSQATNSKRSSRGWAASPSPSPSMAG